LLRDFTMMSFFLSAVGTSQFIFATLNSIPEDAENPVLQYLGNHFRRVKASYQTGRGSQRGTVASAAGAAMLGAGMTLSGSCPGTIFAAAGSGVPGTELVIAGGLLGVGLFTAMERKILPALFAQKKVANNSLEKALDNEKKDAAGPKPWYTSYSKLAFLSSVVMYSASIAFNRYFPNSHRHAAFPINSLTDALRAPSWSPIVAGTLAGLTQLPMLLFGDTFLGTSSQFLSLISPLAPVFRALGLIDEKSEIAKWAPVLSLKTMVGGWGFVASMALGAYASSRWSGTRGVVSGLVSSAGNADTPFVVLNKAHPLIQPVVAGVLLWFGSRTALGCTSGGFLKRGRDRLFLVLIVGQPTGHGISGFSLLSVNSIVATAAMFGSGIASALILKNFV
jgi:hypothetical protein